MTIIYSLGTPDDAAAAIAQLPRLADFDVPPRLSPEEIWSQDAESIERWKRGECENSFLLVAKDRSDTLVGAAFVRLGPEFMNLEPSAHLETLTVAQSHEGQGVGRGLVAAVEREAVSRGARSLSLTVFNTNHRAKALYRHLGFDSELHRYIKPIA